MKNALSRFCRAWWPILLIPLLAVLFLGEALGTKVLQLRDTFAQIAPAWQVLAERVRLGELPLWNPLIACGTPLLSNPFSNGFYPPAWLFVFLDVTQALRVILILHLSLAGIAVYALCRQWKLDRTAALLAGIAFAFGSMTVNCLECSPSLGSMALCPLVILLVEKIFQDNESDPARSWVGSVLRNGPIISALALTAFLQLSAIAEWFYYSAVIAALYGVGRILFFPRTRATVLTLISLGVAGGVAALLGSLIILPALEMVSGSVRAAGIDPSLAMASAHPRHWLSLLQPFLFGKPAYPDAYWAPTIYEFAWGSCYVGIAPLVFLPFAVSGLFQKSLSDKRRFLLGFWVFILLGALLMVAGKYTPLYGFLHENLPGMGRFRFPTKLYFVATLALAVLSGLGFQAWADRCKNREPFGRVLGVLGGLWVLGAVVTAMATADAEFFQTLVGRATPLPPDKAREILIGMSWSLGFGAATMVFLVFSRFRPAQALAFSLWVPALTFMDLRRTSGTIHPQVDAALYERKQLPVLKDLRNEPVGRVFAPQAYCQQYILGEARPEILAWADNVGIGTRYTLSGLPEVRPEGLSQDAYVKVYGLLFSQDSAVRERAADLLGVQTVVVSERFENVFWSGAPKDIRVVKRSAPARVRILSRWTKQSDPNAALQALFNRDFDLSQNVVVEDSPFVPNATVSLSLWSGQEVRPSGEFSVRSVKDVGWNRVEIEASNSEPAILVLNDTWAPGWKVHVDGVLRPILKANLLFRGVFLDPGTHKLEFEYRPDSLLVGATLFTVGMMLCAGLTAAGGILRKRGSRI